tara:strand:+ start:415 stop:945 length:531 start_codon:yes stop_codon:yes gene_type:complete
MSINDRLNEVAEEPLAPSRIEKYNTVYVRSEYFEDGNRIFYSPLDFALNGPDEGSIISRSDKYTGAIHKVKVLRKHYERESEPPCMVEVEVSTMYGDVLEVASEKLWVIVRATPITIKKFNFMFSGVTGTSFSLYPDFFLQKNVQMGQLSPINDVSIAFSTVTGIPKEHLVSEEIL